MLPPNGDRSHTGIPLDGYTARRSARAWPAATTWTYTAGDGHVRRSPTTGSAAFGRWPARRHRERSLKGFLISAVTSVSHQPSDISPPRRGKGRLFGRDDGCDIVIWSAINGTDLSRVAGRIWRMEGELWVRNLSSRHELQVVQP